LAQPPGPPGMHRTYAMRLCSEAARGVYAAVGTPPSGYSVGVGVSGQQLRCIGTRLVLASRATDLGLCWCLVNLRRPSDSNTTELWSYAWVCGTASSRSGHCFHGKHHVPLYHHTSPLARPTRVAALSSYPPNVPAMCRTKRKIMRDGSGRETNEWYEIIEPCAWQQRKANGTTREWSLAERGIRHEQHVKSYYHPESTVVVPQPEATNPALQAQRHMASAEHREAMDRVQEEILARDRDNSRRRMRPQTVIGGPAHSPGSSRQTSPGMPRADLPPVYTPGNSPMIPARQMLLPARPDSGTLPHRTEHVMMPTMRGGWRMATMGGERRMATHGIDRSVGNPSLLQLTEQGHHERQNLTRLAQRPRGARPPG
jgi:hypothetical protein